MADLQLNEIMKQMIAFVDCDDRFSELVREKTLISSQIRKESSNIDS